jgi:hypothetical protein
MGESKGLAEALEQLTLFLSKGGGSEAIVPRQEVVQKIDLSPTDIKLEGVTNYLSWSRRAMLVVDQKDLVTSQISKQRRHAIPFIHILEPTKN